MLHGLGDSIEGYRWMPEALDLPWLNYLLVNAPDANMGAIYSTGGRTVFEYWFVTHDGRTHVPSVGQIHEAIYCATVGASAKEQEESGRCLPD